MSGDERGRGDFYFHISTDIEGQGWGQQGGPPDFILGAPPKAGTCAPFPFVCHVCVYLEYTALGWELGQKLRDLYSISALHYINAGEEGISHFQALLNAIVKDVNNATVEELNTALGLILYKGHKKEKNDELI